MLNEIFARDGVVRLRHALDDHWLEQCELAYQYSLDNPSPLASRPFAGPESFYQDLCNEEMQHSITRVTTPLFQPA